MRGNGGGKSSRISRGQTLCLVAPGVYPLLMQTNPKNVIGPDVHLFLLANELLRHDFDITFITYDTRISLLHNYDEKFNIITIPSKSYNFSMLTILIKVIWIWNAMRKCNANIFIHAGSVSGPVSLFCKIANRKFIYSIGSDALVNRKLVSRNIKGFCHSKFNISSFGNWLDIHLANAIIVQSEYQKTMLERNYCRKGIVIKMPFPIINGKMPEKTNPPIVLWVGSMAEVKQPHLFLKLAEAIPNAKFQMIGGRSSDEELYNTIYGLSRKVSNLEFLGVVPFSEIDKYFCRASILVNTSIFEGFPNAFIQAWMHYVPVISLNADPDNIICNNKLGFHSKTLDKMVEDLGILLNDEKMREEMGRNAREYTEREHNIDLLINKYIEIFNQC